MPRFRRQIAPGSVQHVISRFVDREYRFDVPGARANYLSRVGTALARTDWRVLGYALMSSHVHWVLVAGTRTSAALIKPMHVGFSGWLNRVQQRVGPVFADRHRSLTCEATTAATLLAYVHNNPVRAGLVSDPAESSWTSYQAYLGEGPRLPWLDVRLGFQLCGLTPDVVGRDAFRAFTLERASEPRSVELSGGDLNARRRRARAEHDAPVEIESPSLSEHAANLQIRTALFVPPSCMLREPWLGDTRSLLLAVEQATGVSLFALCSRSRSQHVVSARRLAALTWSLYLKRPTVEIARALGISGSSAATLIARAGSAAHDRAEGLSSLLRSERARMFDESQIKAVFSLSRTVP